MRHKLSLGKYITRSSRGTSKKSPEKDNLRNYFKNAGLTFSLTTKTMSKEMKEKKEKDSRFFSRHLWAVGNYLLSFFFPILSFFLSFLFSFLFLLVFFLCFIPFPFSVYFFILCLPFFLFLYFSSFFPFFLV